VREGVSSRERERVRERGNEFERVKGSERFVRKFESVKGE
jgi:hypothetical protein